MAKSKARLADIERRLQLLEQHNAGSQRSRDTVWQYRAEHLPDDRMVLNFWKGPAPDGNGQPFRTLNSDTSAATTQETHDRQGSPPLPAIIVSPTAVPKGVLKSTKSMASAAKPHVHFASEVDKRTVPSTEDVISEPTKESADAENRSGRLSTTKVNEQVASKPFQARGQRKDISALGHSLPQQSPPADIEGDNDSDSSLSLESHIKKVQSLSEAERENFSRGKVDLKQSTTVVAQDQEPQDVARPVQLVPKEARVPGRTENAFPSLDDHDVMNDQAPGHTLENRSPSAALDGKPVSPRKRKANETAEGSDGESAHVEEWERKKQCTTKRTS